MIAPNVLLLNMIQNVGENKETKHLQIDGFPRPYRSICSSVYFYICVSCSVCIRIVLKRSMCVWFV